MPSLDPAEAQVHGHWQLRHLVAVGAIAEVWAASPVAGNDRTVALKRLHLHLMRHQEVRALFTAEQNLAMALPPHPQVVHASYCDDTARPPFYVMQLAAGRDMRQWLAPVATSAEQQAIPRPLAVELVTNACEAVAHLHRHGWVHGDICPANLIVDAGPTTAGAAATVVDLNPASLVLCDLGIARRIGVGGPVRGTHAYMAPEQVHGQAWTAATDAWALGVVLWELIAGKRLFARGQSYLTMAAVVESEVPPLGDRVLDDLLTRALHKDPTQRIPDARGLADALGALPN